MTEATATTAATAKRPGPAPATAKDGAPPPPTEGESAGGTGEGDKTPPDAAKPLAHMQLAKESPRQLDARKLRDKLGHIVHSLMHDSGGNPSAVMKRAGAALFTAQMAVDVGLAKAEKMTSAEVQAYAANFRSRWPAAWGAACSSNVINFVRFLKLAGLRGDAEDESLEKLIPEYQGMMSKLSDI